MFLKIASLTQQLEVLGRSGTSLRHGNYVIELEVVFRFANYTLPTVSSPYFSPSGLGNRFPGCLFKWQYTFRRGEPDFYIIQGRSGLCGFAKVDVAFF